MKKHFHCYKVLKEDRKGNERAKQEKESIRKKKKQESYNKLTKNTRGNHKITTALSTITGLVTGQPLSQNLFPLSPDRNFCFFSSPPLWATLLSSSFLFFLLTDNNSVPPLHCRPVAITFFLLLLQQSMPIVFLLANHLPDHLILAANTTAPVASFLFHRCWPLFMIYEQRRVN